MNLLRPIENLHYALGQIVYAIARADGEVQKEERQRLLNIVEAELKNENYNFDIASIIFQVMDKDHCNSVEDTYHLAMKQIRLNSHYLTPSLKTSFITLMEKIAKAYPPVTLEELLLLDRFKKDIEPLHGDPLYYSKIMKIKK
ncbi:hypothetical protein [Aurantibacillus circumpalustris]|uniref:hypothetical protein n=1 Tax=Aurantibacillus circumpalustris TaxID=3036359 RepID=UPI00295B6879|nr:hypothetical protein [Aurantibacillus circumpalustris]